MKWADVMNYGSWYILIWVTLWMWAQDQCKVLKKKHFISEYFKSTQLMYSFSNVLATVVRPLIYTSQIFNSLILNGLLLFVVMSVLQWQL